MWPVFVQEVVDVHKKKCEIVDLLRPSRGLGCIDQNIDEIQEIHKQRVVELLQLLLSVEMLWVQSSDLLALQWPDYCVIV